MNNILEIFNETLIKHIQDEYIQDGTIQSKRLIYNSVCKNFPEFKKIFDENFSIDDFREIMYCILNNISYIPKCKNNTCSNNSRLRNYIKGFQECCCKNCVAQYQSSSENFADKISKTKILQNKEKRKDNFISQYDYEINGNYYKLNNYCKHGDILVYNKTAKLQYERNAGFCLKCNEELFNTYIPSKQEISEFQIQFKDFYNKYSHNMKWEWWIMYYPKELKIIVSYFEKYVETFDKNNTDLLECYYQFLHDLKGRPRCCECNTEVKFSHSGNCYNKFCDIHLYGYNKSSLEYDLNEFINSLNIKVEYNKSGIIQGELDVYFPDKNFAIEFNGCWWHCDKFKTKDYHYNKWIQCKNKNIQLMFIWEDDWIYKQDIIKSLIKSKLGLYTNRIYARNCILKIVNAQDTKTFLNTYHLQGYSIDKYRLGLYYNDELISIMTFGKSRFSKDYEIIRYCCKPNYQIIGGANKLYYNFKKLYNINNIISYADCDISIGNLYKQLGMHEIGITENWKWLCGGKRYNRLNKIRFEKTDLFKCYSAGTLKYTSY